MLTHDHDWNAEGAEVARDAEDALALAGAIVSVIGGAQIFRLFEPQADRVELTEVHDTPAGDTDMPAFDPAVWRETAREDHPAESGRPAYSFVTLARRSVQ